MKHYVAIVHQEGDSAYALSFPDLPGAFAAADDWDRVQQAATEALDLWFEDRPDVEPGPMSAIRDREDVQQEIKNGGVLIAVPYIPADTAPARVQVSIDRGLLRSIDQTAKARGMTRSSFIASAARRELVG